MHLLIEIMGWSGSILVITAYGLNSYQKIRSDSALFYSLNITGGVLLVIYSVYKDAYANVFINAVWIAIAVPAVLRLLLKKH
jgi:lipid-A-disaccharide synthase-like uncharacterized protein